MIKTATELDRKIKDITDALEVLDKGYMCWESANGLGEPVTLHVKGFNAYHTDPQGNTTELIGDAAAKHLIMQLHAVKYDVLMQELIRLTS